MTNQISKPPHNPLLGRFKVKLEMGVALAGNTFAIVLLVMAAIYAGPLWRDELNTLNVAQMPSLKELWDAMPFESFPPLWPLLLRLCSTLGLIGGDFDVRLLGLSVGLLFFASLWLCARWLGGRAPILSIGLLGCLPTFIFTVGSNRAYGLAGCLLVLSFGLIWRLVESPTRGRVLAAFVICFLFAHCVYYDVIFLGGMLAAGALVGLQRRQWRTVAALVAIGILCAASLTVYLPIIHRGSAYLPLMQMPNFNCSVLWSKFSYALTARSSGQPGAIGRESWLWMALILGGAVVACWMQQKHTRPTDNNNIYGLVSTHQIDLALFCVASMLLGGVGYFLFLIKLRTWTETWYYFELLCLCAISLDGVLGIGWPRLRPWGWMRTGFVIGIMVWYSPSAWSEAHTRRSNVDLIAAVLNEKAMPQDLIVVQGAWEGITFNRYYHGQIHWETIPPVDSHLVHRNDLLFAKMHDPDAMAPVLTHLTDTLRTGNTVWIVGNISTRGSVKPLSSGPGAQWLGISINWNAQVGTALLNQATNRLVVEMQMEQPICCLEDLPLMRFSGYKTPAN